jgi:hypothetical protein
MTHPRALRILIAIDAVAGRGITGAFAPSHCLNAHNVVAQQRRRAMQRVAS